MESIVSSSPKTFTLITGATGGLGKAFAVECASRGWNLYLTDLNPTALATLATSLHSTYGIQVQYGACDLMDAAARNAFFDSLRQAQLHFTALINVAGIEYEGLFLELTAPKIRSIVRVNIESTLEITHTLLRMRESQEPFWMITVASMAAFYPMPVKATYASSKRFLLNFFLALREEIRPLEATVTILCPAGMPTTQENVEAIEAQGWAGYMTTCNVGQVAAGAVDAALKGQTIYIPGAINRLMHTAGGLIPPVILARMISWRWNQARSRRGLAAPIAE